LQRRSNYRSKRQRFLPFAAKKANAGPEWRTGGRERRQKQLIKVKIFPVSFASPMPSCCRGFCISGKQLQAQSSRQTSFLAENCLLISIEAIAALAFASASRLHNQVDQ
jgi:hypothetical protein